MGATRQQVIELIGWPASTSKAGEREILNYPDFTVVLEKNQMTSLQFKPGKRKPPAVYSRADAPAVPVASEPSRVATPEEMLGPDSTRTDSRPTLSTPPPAAPSTGPHVAAISPPPAKVMRDPFAQLKTEMAWMVGLFVGLAFLKIWLRRSQQKNRRKAGDIFPPPPRKASGGEPPLIVPRRALRAKPDPIKDGWSLALLKEIEWHRFEQVVAAYERALGHDAELTDFGPDGGIDIRVFEKGTRTFKRVIQCKAHSKPIGVSLVREFLGVMTLQKIPQGTFYTTGSYSDDALAAFQNETNLKLINGPTFLNRIQALPLSAQLKLFEIATEGDYTTPSCPSCGVKMTTKTFDENPGEEKWVCSHFPRCRQNPMTKKQTD